MAVSGNDLASSALPSHHGAMRLALYSLSALLLSAGLSCARLNHPNPARPQLVSGSVATRESTARSLRVVTYNVHMEPAARILDVIQRNARLRSADILLLQEIEDYHREGRTRAEQIASELGMSFAYAPGYGIGSGGSHGVAILSRHALEDLRIIELPYYGVVVNSARRVALAATITLGGQDIRVYSVHLDNRVNPRKRRKQLAPVLEAAAHFPGPVIIGGDLNTSPFCWVGNLLPLPCGLQDDALEEQVQALGYRTPLADIGPTAKWMAMKLDAIYTRGLVAGPRAVERSVRLSDHLPVWLDLKLEAERVSQGTN